MITQAQIQSISQDLTECQVRIPLFESVYDNAPKIITAKFMFQPGLCNGYNSGDVVWVAFDRDMASLPVVLGKIYMGTQNMVTTANCALIGDSLVVSNLASLPASTEFTGNIPANYNSVLKIYDKIKTLEQHTQATVSSAKSMAIKKKLTPIKDANGSVLYWQYQLRISLVGFTDDDIGKKIVLLRTTKHSCKENASAAGYKHPANYDNSYFNAKTTGKIQRLGYGNIAGKRVPLSTSAETFDAVPSWMPHNGFAETEWTIGYTDIHNGEMIIDLEQIILPMLLYKTVDGKKLWKSLIGIGTNLGAMSFKFGLTEKNSQAIEQLAIGTLRVGVNKNNTDTMELVNNGKLSTSMLYTSIK